MSNILCLINYDVTVFERRSTLLTKTRKDDEIKAIKIETKNYDSEIIFKTPKVDKEQNNKKTKKMEEKQI